MKTTINSVLFLLFILPTFMFGQNQFTGTVTEQLSSLPLPGVNVIIKGTTTGTATDFDGIYQIQANIGDVLVFSYLGYISKEITYKGESNLNVTLDEDAAQLDEVIVIGYGTTTKKDATGAVVAVTEKEFNKGVVANSADLISGRVAGVSVVSGGAPGSGSVIRIRGGSSLDASNDPLIVINGLPISNDNVGGSRSILASLNPNDIESFSVLKDASATAIYGSRASNGVIIIETKKGTQDLKIDVNTQLGIGVLPNTLDVFGADEFRQLIADREALGQSGISTAGLGNANTDWQDEIYQNSYEANTNVSVRGALFKGALPTRLSIGYTDVSGLRRTSEFKRTTTALTLTPKFFDDHLKVRLNANLNFEDNRFADNVEGGAIGFDPTQPVYDSSSQFNGYFQYTNPDGTRNNQAPSNPVAALLEKNNSSNVRRYFGNLELDYKMHFLPELRAIINMGYDNGYGSGTSIIDAGSRNGVENIINDVTSYPGSIFDYNSEKTNQTFDGFFVYKKEYDKWWFDATAGYSYQKFQSQRYSSGEQLNYVPPGTEDPSPARTTIDPDVVLIGYFGRANFSYENKYLLTVSYRRDGSSRFSEDNRWGNFPSAAFAWNIGDEDFLKGSNTLSNLKLRLSWGITGQQDIAAAYAYLPVYGVSEVTSQVIINGQPVNTGIPQFRNEAIKWEETTAYNVGVDYGFFDNKLNGSLDVFYKVSEDLLSFAPIADGGNFGNAGFQNIGSLTSQGIEFAINADIIEKNDFNWNINYNITYIDLEIDELALDQDILVGGISGGTGGTAQIQSEGFAPYSFYVYKQLYDTAGAPIEGAYADLNGDGLITPDDRYIYKNRTADITTGFRSNMSYKNWDFSFNLRVSLGNNVYNNVNSSNAQYNNLLPASVLGNIPSSVLDTNFNNTPDVILSDIYIEDASFLKMDNITLGYTFNNVVSDGSRIRLYIGVQNAFVLTDYSGLDPEVFSGIDNTIYPRARTYMVGANFNF